MGMSNYQELVDKSFAMIEEGKWDEAFALHVTLSTELNC